MAMSMLGKHINNALLYSKCLDHEIEVSPYDSIEEVVTQSDALHTKSYLNNLIHINEHYLLFKGILSSGFFQSSLISRWQDGEYPYADHLRLLPKKAFSKTQKFEAYKYFLKQLGKFELTISPNDPEAVSATRNIKTEAAFEEAWNKVTKKSDVVTIEQYQNGDVFKLYILNNELFAVYGVVPPFVIGHDGKTVKELALELAAKRKKNLLYRNAMLEIFDNLPFDKVLEDGDVYLLNHNLTRNKGAMLLRLPDELLAKYETFKEKLRQEFGFLTYAQIDFCSTDVAKGDRHSSFFIRNISVNSSDIAPLISTEKGTQAFIDNLNKYTDAHQSQADLPTQKEKNQTELLNKAEEFNGVLNYHSQIGIIREAAHRAGIEFKLLHLQGYYYLEDPASGKRIYMYQAVPETVNFYTQQLCAEKHLIKTVVNEAGVNTPKGKELDIQLKEEAWKMIESSDHSWVVKPTNLSLSEGVSLDIKTREQFDAAWAICESLKVNKVMVEEYLDKTNDYRVLVIGDKVTAITQRVPAYVIGDGEHSIVDLIKEVNLERQKNLYCKNNPVKVTDEVKAFLKNQGLTVESVPEKDQRVKLCNMIATADGGERWDQTDEMHPDWLSIFIKTKNAVLNPFCLGLDLLAEDISRAPDEQQWAIIELNVNPHMAMQLFPNKGKRRDVGKVFVETLFGKTEPEIKTYHLRININRQGGDYCKWFADEAKERSITGYVQNQEDPEMVDAYIQGPATTALEMLSYVRQYFPSKMQLRNVHLVEVPSDTTQQFEAFEIKA